MSLKPGLLVGTPSVHSVRSLIEPYILRRRKNDALPELPEKVYEEVWLELSPEQRETYEKVKQEGILELKAKGTTVTLQHVFQVIQKLKQICNMHPDTDESCKLEYLKDSLLEVTEEGDKALVFSQYPKLTLARLSGQLSEFCPLIYDGTLSDSLRETVIGEFEEDESKKVLLISVRSGGTGLTLTRANYVYHFDLWWNPSVAAQAEDRAHRIGQTKTVFVVYLLTTDTIEERIHRLLAAKRRLFDAVIDSMSDQDIESSLTEEELFGLLDLAKPVRADAGVTAHNGLMTSMSAVEFENLIATLYERLGYSVRVTQRSRDGGVDIYAKKSTASGLDYCAIQCKHYPEGVVGVEAARALYGVIQDEPRITKAVIATSGTFSRDCRLFVQSKRIELWDGQKIEGLYERLG